MTKSLAAFAWAGNAAPRVSSSGPHMLNAVGLAGPGVEAWRRDVPAERWNDAARDVVGSIWGRTVDEFAGAARAMRGAGIAALEVNASCPNLESRSAMFAHSASATARGGRGVRCGGPAPVGQVESQHARPRGDRRRRPSSGCVGPRAREHRARAGRRHRTSPAVARQRRRGRERTGMLPVSLRAVFECRAAFRRRRSWAWAGVASGEDVVAMLMAGANAVEVGTATFADPRAPWRILRGLERWMRRHDVARVHELIGVAHG